MKKEMTKELLVNRIKEFAMMNGYGIDIEALSPQQQTLIIESMPNTLILDAILEGFSWEQCYELYDGLANGINTDLYNNKDYNPNQMLQIKKGLIDRRDVTTALDPNLNWAEMEKIVKKAKRI